MMRCDLHPILDVIRLRRGIHVREGALGAATRSVRLCRSVEISSSTLRRLSGALQGADRHAFVLLHLSRRDLTNGG